MMHTQLPGVPVDAPPTRSVVTEWGAVMARCSHPHYVSFFAGFGDDRRLTVHGVAYCCGLTVSRAPLADDDPVQRQSIGDPWYVTMGALYFALRRNLRADATNAARATFKRRILPTLRAWLDSEDARALLTAGHAHWRRHVTRAAAATEADLVAAFQRLQTITERIARGEIVSHDDERFATRTRALIP